MFKELYPLITSCQKMTLVMSPASDGRVKVIVAPLAESEGNALNQPLYMVETPDVLDREFAECIRSFQNARLSLKEQIAATNAILEQQKADSLKKATEALDAKQKSSSGSACCEEDEANLDTPVAVKSEPDNKAHESASLTLSDLF